MTVISTIINRSGTVHATDSLITVLEKDKTRTPKEWEKSKIVRVKAWRGAISYWGLAIHKGHNWNTSEWLQEQSDSADGFASAEEFAADISEKLNEVIGTMVFEREIDKGIGLHFTTYERVCDYWVPELFLITNFGGANHSVVSDSGVKMNRHTYHTVVNVPPTLEHREEHCRQTVHAHIHEARNMIIYNNGDPLMFNVAVRSIFDLFAVASNRGLLSDVDDLTKYLKMARRPIEIVSEAQQDFYKPDQRVVGGRPHALGITPSGEYVTLPDDPA